MSGLPSRRGARIGVVAAIAVTTAMTLTGTATTASAAAAAKPGLHGATITISTNVELTEGSFDIASDSNGTTYLGWISTPDANPNEDSQVYLCVLPLHASACQGGIATTDPSDNLVDPADLRILTPRGGPVELVWYEDTTPRAQITEATVTNDSLGSPEAISSAPTNGELLDAELAPSGDIWLVSAGDSGDNIEIRPGIENSPVTVKTGSFETDYARLAFAGNTPIVALHEGGAVTKPVAYTYLKGGSWTKVANVARTWTSDANLGLTSTKSGVRLIASENNADYHPVVAKWNGHGFGKPTLTGDTSDSSPSSHDFVADASGRAADVSLENSQLAIANLANTSRAAIVRIPVRGTAAGGDPQLATTPRGDAWVAWSVLSNNQHSDDTLYVAPILLPGAHHSSSHGGAHGVVTVSGPASCLPDVSIAIGVSGHPKTGWRVAAKRLSLAGKTVRASLNGATLTAGKTYTLTGVVTFSSRGSHETVKVSEKFRSCPKP
jgi:hypothetical protein